MRWNEVNLKRHAGDSEHMRLKGITATSETTMFSSNDTYPNARISMIAFQQTNARFAIQRRRNSTYFKERQF